MNSNLPFVSIRHRKYENTFLQSVLLVFKFKPILDSKSIPNFKESLENYISSVFGLKLKDDTEISFWKQGISVSRSDHSSGWSFSNGCILVNVSVKDYVSFVDSILPQAFKMRTFLSSVMGIDKVIELSVRKVNLWQFHDDKGSNFNPEDIRRSVFTGNLLKERTNCELEDAEKRLQNFRKIKFCTNENDVYIRHIYKKTTTSFLLFLDTEAILKREVKINDIEASLMNLNQILFDAFHWSVNSSIINIMEGSNHE